MRFGNENTVTAPYTPPYLSNAGPLYFISKPFGPIAQPCPASAKPTVFTGVRSSSLQVLPPSRVKPEPARPAATNVRGAPGTAAATDR